MTPSTKYQQRGEMISILWMTITLGRERSKRKINLDLEPTSGIITDIIKKNYISHEFKYQITEDGSGRMLGEHDDSRFPS